ncbi:MAG: histidine phosphatase family protein [Elainellaceae cyanobacterium]
MQGHLDESTLTEVGRAGACQVGATLQGLHFSAVYSSPLKRAKETAELIRSTLSENGAAVPDLRLTNNLKEINLTLWEGLSFEEVEEKYPEGYQIWRDRPHELRMTRPTEQGVEEFYPVVALYDQARDFWNEVLPRHNEETILVVAHSGINRCLIGAAIGLGPKSYQVLHQSNCGISVLNFAGQLGDPVQMESLNLTAHLGQPLPKPRTNKGPRFLLVRHGETQWNREKRFQGQIDVPLNDHGRLQAGQACLFLQDVPIDRAVSSPMLRPKETAEIILEKHPGIPLDLDANLCEISHGLWEGKLEAEIEQEFPGELEQWKTAPETVQMPEGENLQQVWDRAVTAWDAILQSTPANLDDRPFTTLVVAHDAINKALLCYLAGQEPKDFWTFKQGNGSVTVIDYPRGLDHKPLIHAMNITIHLGGVLDKTAAGAL